MTLDLFSSRHIALQHLSYDVLNLRREVALEHPREVRAVDAVEPTRGPLAEVDGGDTEAPRELPVGIEVALRRGLEEYLVKLVHVARQLWVLLKLRQQHAVRCSRIHQRIVRAGQVLVEVLLHSCDQRARL